MDSIRSILVVLRGVAGTGKSTVAKLVASALEGDYRVLELDNIKIERYGTTTKCRPKEDFPKLGQDAHRLLQRGINVVAVEAFVDREHVEWFLQKAGRSSISPGTFFVWLDCNVETAIQRKADVLTPEVVKGQHARLSRRHRITGELTIETSNRTPEEVAQTIVAHIQSLAKPETRESV
jgi:shikimate kinase